MLTGITKNTTIIQFPDGERVASTSLTANWNTPQVLNLYKKYGIERRYYPLKELNAALSDRGGVRFVPGYMLRYIYFIDKKSRAKLTVPEIPFSKIDEIGAGMYKGENISREERNEAGRAWKESFEKK